MKQAYRLGDACELLTDGTHYTPEDVGTGVPFLTVKDVSDAGLNFTTCSKISLADFLAAKKASCAPRVGDVLFSKDGTVGKVHLIREEREFAVLSSLAILRPKPDLLEGNFLSHFLRSPLAVEAAGRSKTGSAIRRIVLRDLGNLIVPLPPLAEQRRIATILDEADRVRVQRRAALARISDLTQAIFLEMFGDWSARGQDDRLVPIGPQLDFLTSGSRGWANYYQDRGSKFLRIQNVRRDELDLGDIAFVEPPDTAEAKRTRVRSGDVLLSITADLGRTGVVPEDIGEAFINQHLAILRTSSFEPRFLKAVAAVDAGLQPVLHDFEESLRDLTADKSELRIKTCIQKQVNLLEALGQKHPATASNTLGQMCNEVGTWPHEKVKDAVRDLYKFASGTRAL